MPQARRGDRQIHWERHGDGPALILLPGIGAGAQMFGTLPRRFARHGLGSISMSPVGVSPSSLHRGPYDLDEAARDVLAVLDDAGIDRAVILGVSFGGKVALVACGLAPERFAGLAMLSSSAIASPRALAVHRFFEIAARNLDDRDLADLISPFLFGGTFHERRAELVANIVRSMRTTEETRALMVEQARAGVRFGGEHRARHLHCPALCLGGNEDALTPAAAVQRTAQLMPHGRFVEIPGAGHSLLLESDAAFEHVVQFAREVLAGGD